MHIFYCSIFAAAWASYVGVTDCATNTQWKFYETDTTADLLDFENDEGSDDTQCCALMFDQFDYRWLEHLCEDSQYPLPTVCEIDREP